MREKPVFTGVLQVGVVVRNLDEAVKKYEDIYGIGPWAINVLDSSNVNDMTVHGKRQDFAIRVGFAFVGNTQWELIEPLDDKSIYAEFLNEHGEGLHHVAFGVENHDETVGYLGEKGVHIIQSGTSTEGFTFTYLNTREGLYCLSEIYKMGKG